MILPEASPEDSNYDDQAEPSSDDGDVDDDTSELPAQARQGAKGKGKELSTPAYDEDTDDADQDPQDPDANNPLAPGRLPAEAIRKAIALGERTFKEATEIAKEYEKSPGAILIAAGLSVKPTRTENPWNMYQAWYKMKHPKSSDGE
jgi:hypothetical protein